MDTSSTEYPVQRQLDAYNARTIDAFMAWWAEDCQYYEFPSRLLANGASEIRERHIERFKDPVLFGRLIKRIAVANLVVDQEVVTRTFPDGTGEIDVVAIYEIENGKIARAWFKMGLPRLGSMELLRLAKPEDAGAVRGLIRAAYGKWIPVIGREPLPMTADYDEALRKHRVDLLYIGGTLAGVIEMIPQDEHLLVENVAVTPAFQGRGLGRKLLAHAEGVAASLGQRVVKLYTNKLFAANVELYLKIGYSIDREEEFKGGFTVYMSKPIGVGKR